MTQYQPPMAPPPPAPPYGGYGAPGMPAPRKSNGAAIGSLVCGLLFCIPFLTGLIAIILGIVGIKKAKDPQAGGKGLAIAGLILGVLSIGIWGLFGGAIFAAFSGTSTQRDLAKAFITDLAAGNVDAALTKTQGMDREEIVELSDQLKKLGPITDTTVLGFSAGTGQPTIVSGSITFGSTGKGFQAELVKGSDGSWKIKNFVLQ